MEAPPHSSRAARPGAGIATCLLAIAVLSTLTYALVKSRQQAQFDRQARHTNQPEQQAESSGTAKADRKPVEIQPHSERGSLESWPPESAQFEPPSFGPPAFGPPSYDPFIPPPLPNEELDLPPILLPPLNPSPTDPLGLDADLIADGIELDDETLLDIPARTAGNASAADDSQPDISIDVEIEEEHAGLPELPPADVAGPQLGADDSFSDLSEEPSDDSTTTPALTFAPPAFSPPGPLLELLNSAAEAEAAERDATADDAELAIDVAPETDLDTGSGAGLMDAASLDDLLQDTPAPQQVARLLTSDVQAGFALGRSGALYAARAQFIGVLRKVALAKDAAEGTGRHSAALAAGLRALDEAVAFVPRGDALEADLDVAAIAASHTTPLYAESRAKAGKKTARRQWVLPYEAIARYHRYAQLKLAAAAQGDQAGSMALHGLGKTYARLAVIDEAPLAERTSLTMYRSAVGAHSGNYLAANELGVGLAKAGRHAAAERALARAISAGGTSTVYRNLAMVQAKLGRTQLAAAAQQRAEQLAVRERSAGEFSRSQGVQWVRPDSFSRVADASQRPGAGRRPGQLATAAAPVPIGPPARPNAVRPQQPTPRSAEHTTPWRQPLVRRAAPRSSAEFRLPPGNVNARPVPSQTIVR